MEPPSVVIKITCPCNIYPLIPHFYIAKLGYEVVFIFSLFLLQNIDCGYLLKPPGRGGSNMYPQSMFRAKIRKIKKNQMKIFISYNLKNLFILHEHVFVMVALTFRSRYLGHMTKMAAMPITVKTLQKSSQEAVRRCSRNLVCSTGNSGPLKFAQMVTLG